MVSKIEKIGSASSTRAIVTNHSISIASEPDGVWVDHVQSGITAGLERQGAANRLANDHGEEAISKDTDQEHDRHVVSPKDGKHAELPNEEHLSGESERIGSGNWDDNIPFGKHVGYL